MNVLSFAGRAQLRLVILAIAIVGVQVDPGYASQECVGCNIPAKTRVTDGGWSTEVVLGPGVAPADAELVLRAARRSEITDAPINNGQIELRPAIDLSGVYAIGDASWFFLGSDSWPQPKPGVRYFSLAVSHEGASHVWEHVVSVRDGRVERIAVVVWEP